MELTQKYIKSILHYNRLTGLFTWKQRLSRRAKIGSIAGTINGRGYIEIGIAGKRYRAHRLAFLYTKGYIPKEIDHEDHKRDNNIFKNLNAVTHKENSKNISLPTKSVSGTLGVNKGRRNKWRARIKIDGIEIGLGHYTNKDDAIKARKEAEVKYNFHKNSGV